ncbi:helix-turn-helix transcriptional regulator [Streptomyces sp. ACA25]|uniref:helix-turn-helix domain-containing protein n=1 Tax=Streptomyces sp. ACA25 TaxID=3022596 RepID=UPI002307DE4C|nr:helix-turn-helix transcriptional regulator [Streptomyces sp. ACA25]MDB1088175.1 helix-turn-helix transcriptional regulator [Streptomyces sp. ACA25]
MARAPGGWDTAEPSDGQRALGAQIKHLRERAGLTQFQLGERIGYGEDQVRKVEAGKRPAKPEFLRGAEEVLNSGGLLEVAARKLTRTRFPAHFQDVARLEEDAIRRYDYECRLIPGLLQTKAYAHALISAHRPTLEPEEVDQRVQARIERQALLSRKPVLEASFIITETALLQPVGGVPLLRTQLQHLLEATRPRNVDLQVMPISVGAHCGLDGPMTLLQDSEHEWFGYLECQDVGVVLSDRKHVSSLSLRYDTLRSQALNVEESSRLIERMAGEL